MTNQRSSRWWVRFWQKHGAIALLFWGSLFLLSPSPCEAQGAGTLSQGYIFVSPGILTHEQTVFGTIHFGGGAEMFVYRKLAAALEAGYLNVWDPPDYMHEPGDKFGLVSLNVSYVKSNRKKFVPFLTGGYSLGFRNKSASPASFINFGVGATYWAKHRTGIRFELRDYFYPTDANDHYLGVRIGLAFR